MIIRLMPCLLALILTLMTSEVCEVEGMINIPWQITRLLGLTTDVSIEFNKLSKVGRFFSKIGLLGPFALSLFSKAGVALGILGTAATAVAFAAHEMSNRDNDEDFYERNYYDYPSYEGYHPNLQEVDSYSHYRRRRSIQFNELKKNFGVPLEKMDHEKMFRVVGYSDSTQCAQKLICELASKSKQHLHQDEILILNLIRYSTNVKTRKSKKKIFRAKYPYEKAYLQGQRRRNCHNIYSKCPFTESQMMALIRVIGHN